MPILGAWLARAFSGLFGYFAANFTERTARVLAVMALVLGLYVTFYAAILTLANALAAVLPPEVSIAASWFWPANGYHCISVVIGAKFLSAALRFQLKQMRMVAGVT